MSNKDNKSLIDEIIDESIQIMLETIIENLFGNRSFLDKLIFNLITPRLIPWLKPRIIILVKRLTHWLRPQIIILTKKLTHWFIVQTKRLIPRLIRLMGK